MKISKFILIGLMPIIFFNSTKSMEDPGDLSENQDLTQWEIIKQS